MTEQNTYTLEELQEKLTPKQKKFCHEYIVDWNATRSYKKAYGIKDDNSAAVSGHNLLRNPKIKQYITFIEKDIAKEAGVSKLRIINELAKIAFNSIAHFHDTWIDRKEFETLTDEQKACIESIDSKKIVSEAKGYEVEHVKIKLYSKVEAMRELAKMLGFNEPEKINSFSYSVSVTKEEARQISKDLEGEY